jgi:type III pantothenate kinase
MLLTVDIGNTNIVMGLFKGEELVRHWRMSSLRDRTSDEYGVLLGGLLSEAGPAAGVDVTGAIISCVVPSLRGTFVETLRRYAGSDPLVVGPGIKTGMPILTDDPREVGADRIVNAVAAYSICRSAVIVVDFGTAITFDYVTDKGEYGGGAIAPGIRVASEALFQNAAQLSRVEISKPGHVIGKNTQDSLRAGIFYGFVGLIDGTVERMKEESGTDARVFATGGLAPFIAKETRTVTDVDEFLILKGLRIIYEENRQ